MLFPISRQRGVERGQRRGKESKKDAEAKKTLTVRELEGSREDMRQEEERRHRGVKRGEAGRAAGGYGVVDIS